MKISRVKIFNIRSFEDFELNFDGENVLFLGDNGEGKSTLLRSIAMGLCDESSAAALFRELPGEYVRRQPNVETKIGETGYIEIDLSAGGGYTYRIVTRVVSLAKFERVSQWELDKKRRHLSTLYKIRGNGVPKQISQWDAPISCTRGYERFG